MRWNAQFQIPKLKTIQMHICRVRNKVKEKHSSWIQRSIIRVIPQEVTITSVSTSESAPEMLISF